MSFIAPPTALADNDFFWSGAKITDYFEDLDDLTAEEVKQNLKDALTDAIMSADGGMGFFQDNSCGDNYDTDYLYWKEGKTWDGYTLISAVGGYQPGGPGTEVHGAILVDMKGKIVKSWPLNPFPAKMYPGGYLMGGLGTFVQILGVPKLVATDWFGNIKWEWDRSSPDAEDGWYDQWEIEKQWVLPCPPFVPCDPVPDPANPVGTVKVSGWHHDFERSDFPAGYYAPYARLKKDAKILILAHNHPSITLTCPNPDDTENCISEHRLYEDTIYELDHKKNLLFSWSPWEYFDQLGFDEEARETLLVARYGSANPEDSSDWMHLNTATYVGPNKWWSKYRDYRFHPDNIIWDARGSNIIAIIARHDHPKGKWASGDIVWKIGPNYTYGNKEYKLGQIIGQHQAHIIPKGLPGAGNMLMFDNGGGAGVGPLLPGLGPNIDANGQGIDSTVRPYSRIIEFNPRTLKMVWEYAQPKPTLPCDENPKGNERQFFSRITSGAQRLPNGNTFICEGTTGRVFEITKKGEVVWEYYFKTGSDAPFIGGPGMQLLYRAYRIPYWWVPKHVHHGKYKK